MPVLKNAKYERFAQLIVEGIKTEDAYEQAGYKAHRGNASRLRTNESVLRRVEELQGKAAKKVLVTVESITQELEEARKIALNEKQTSAAVSASMGKAKLFGLGIERRHLSGQLTVLSITPEHLDGLSSEELNALEAAYPVLEKLGLVRSDSGSEAEAEE